MKKVILFLFTLSAVVSAQARVLSSGGSSEILSGGKKSSADSSVTYTGKVSSEGTGYNSTTNSTPAPTTPAPTTPAAAYKAAVAAMAGAKKTKQSAQPEAAYSANTGGEKIMTSKKDLSSSSRISRFYLGVNFANLKSDGSSDLDKDIAASGVTVGFDIAKNLYKELVYMSFGLDMSYSDMSYGYDDNLLYSVALLDFTIPINVGVNLKLGDKYAIRPYVGLGMSVGAYGDYRRSNGDGYPFFDTDDANRVRVGAQYGVGFALKRFYIGVEGRSQFNELYTETKLNTAMILLGVTF